jgi:hypothetical protein
MYSAFADDREMAPTVQAVTSPPVALIYASKGRDCLYLVESPIPDLALDCLQLLRCMR